MNGKAVRAIRRAMALEQKKNPKKFDYHRLFRNLKKQWHSLSQKVRFQIRVLKPTP